MKKITVKTYRKDKFYPKVVRATAELLEESDEISPAAILLRIGNLTSRDYEAWRHGRIPYLEKVFQGNLSKANRYLRIIGFHAHDLNMIPVHRTYRQVGKRNKLRFTRSNIATLENLYSRHFRRNQGSAKQQVRDETKSENETIERGNL
ncbi:MAG: hypothetical protein WC082_02160 [Victivallales bacterium]